MTNIAPPLRAASRPASPAQDSAGFMAAQGSVRAGRDRRHAKAEAPNPGQARTRSEPVVRHAVLSLRCGEPLKLQLPNEP